jgi:hypothetical protein
MNKFDALKQFQSWPREWQELCGEYWAECEESFTLPSPAQDQPKAAPKVAPKVGYLNGTKFATYELKEIQDLLDSGCNQSEAARVMFDRHGQARSLGAYKLKANQVDQKRRGVRKRSK